MKRSLFVVACLCIPAVQLAAEDRELVRQWETEPVLKTPESVLFDGTARVLYVSNIDGREAWTKDGKGSIAKVGLDGKVVAAEWVSGLNAPKGMGLHNGRLYVADIDRVAVIDIAKSAIAETIAVPGAQRLNDISIDRAGVVYVSDSQAGKVHAITNGRPAVHLENLRGPNGLLAHGDDLYVLDQGTMYRVGKDKNMTRIVEGLEGGTDGIEHVQGDEFVVSCWQGVIYRVDAARGQSQLLLDTRSRSVHSADIGYDARNRVVYVPTFFTNTVVAYSLK